MNLSKTIYFSLFLCISLSGVGEAFAQTLNNYLETAAENNPALKSKYQQYLAALERVPQSGALPDPSLSFGYFISPVETRVGPQRSRFSLQQMLPWFGTLDARKGAATQEAKVRFEEFMQAKNELYFTIKASYYQLFDIREEMKLTEENIKVLESYERLATQKYENALSTMVDILRVQMQIRKEQNQLLILAETMKAQRSTFNTLLNRSPLTEVQVPAFLDDTLVLEDIDKISDAIIARHPSLSVLKEEANLLNEQERLAQLSGKPNLGVGLDYVIVGNRSDMEMPDNGKDVIMPMVSLSLPLFNRQKYKAMRKEILVKQEANQLTVASRENELINTLNKVLQDYQIARNNIQLYEAQMESTQQAISILNSAYESTSERFKDILQFQLEHLSYSIMLNKALTESRIAKAKLDELTAVEITMNDAVDE